MKIFEKKTGYPIRYLKLFGVTLYEWKFEKETGTYTRKVFGGLITTILINDPSKCLADKVIKILNIPVYKRMDDGKIRIEKFFSLFSRKSKLEKIVKKEYEKYFQMGHDGLILLHCNSGEPYLFLKHFIYPFIKKENIENPLILYNKKYHLELISAFCPDIKAEYTLLKESKLLANPSKIDGIKLFAFLPSPYFEMLKKEVKENNDVHYFDYMLHYSGIKKEELTNTEFIPSIKDKETMLQKIKETGLNLENFVFICPESLSCRGLDSKFWISVIKYYQLKGYDIFLNIAKDDLDLSGVEFKKCFLTFYEAMWLSKMSKMIVGARSGFLEFLCESGIDIHSIYGPFCGNDGNIDLTEKEVMKTYALEKIPFRKSKVFEYSKEEFLKIISDPIKQR